MFKIFAKKGQSSYKEKRLLDKLKPAIEKEIAKNPKFIDTFKPATNQEELQYYVDKYCIEEANILSETPNPTTMSDKETKIEDYTLSDDKKIDLSQTKTTVDSEKKVHVDPFNAAEPTERDYVRSGDGFGDKPNTPEQPITDFQEPTNEWDAYNIPLPDNQDPNKPGQTQPGANTAQQTTTEKPKSAPINPMFDEMSAAKKKKQTKTFAKGIVNVVIGALEFGYVWWVTKDIDDAAVFKLEQQGIDMNILITLEENQQATIREFFSRECAKAPIRGHVTEDEREDMVDSLADWLSEKGFAPTTGQSALMSFGSVIGRLTMNAIQSKAQTASIINQLKAMQAEDAEDMAEAMQEEKSNSPAPSMEKRPASVIQEKRENLATTSPDVVVSQNTTHDPDDLSDLGIKSENHVIPEENL